MMRLAAAVVFLLANIAGDAGVLVRADRRLFAAVRSGSPEKVRHQLDVEGHHHDFQDEHGRSLLLLAASHGHTEIGRLLIDRGCNVNALSKEGRTALHNAAYLGHTDFVKMLLEHDDIEIDHQEKRFGFTPLLKALNERHEEIARMLIAAGADAHLKAKNGWDALAVAERHKLHLKDLHEHVLDHVHSLREKARQEDAAASRQSEEL